MAIEKRYILDKYYDFNSITEKIFLGSSNNKVCRFCNGYEPDVKFRTIAHAIPEQLGNKMLISNYECDECNQKFGKMENDLAIFLGPIRAIYSIPGKKKRTSKFKTNGFCIENEQNTIVFKDMCDKSKNIKRNANFNFKDKSLDFNIDRNGYIPNNVFKSFVKMALSIVPDEIFSRLHVYSKFLNNDLECIPNSYISEIFIPGMNENKKLTVYTLINNESTISSNGSILPLVIFSVRIKGFEYQINLYENNFFGKRYTKIKINPILDSYQTYMNLKCTEQVHDMTSKEKAKNKFNISFSFEHIIDVTDQVER